jgi:hypothetical protein
MILPGGIIGGAPQVKAVEFTASTDMLSRASALTGAVDGSQATTSFWFRPTGLAASNQVMFRIGTAVTFVRSATTGTLRIDASLPGVGSRIGYTSGATLPLSSWYHILVSWTLPGTNVIQVYISDAVDTPGSSTLTTGNVGLTATPNGLGISAGGTPFVAGDFAEFWFAPTYIDLSVTANRRKFIKADGKPAFLGLTGQRPTGSSPLIYLKGPASNWGTNSGTGGNFTVTGTFTDTTPPP